MSIFEPVFTTHAIERCAVSWAFNPPVPQKVFEQLIKEFASFYTSVGFEGSQPILGFNVDTATGKITPVPSGGPSNYRSKDGRWNVILSPDAIILSTESYIRWKNIEDAHKKYVDPALEKFEEIVSVAGAKLEYWDRFNWKGDFTDFDISLLLKDKQLVDRLRPPKAQREWHNNSGWFEYIDVVRRLYNINIAINEINYGLSGPIHPSVGIYTMVNDQGREDRLDVFEGSEARKEILRALHNSLKDQLAELLNDNMNQHIGLVSGG